MAPLWIRAVDGRPGLATGRVHSFNGFSPDVAEVLSGEPTRAHAGLQKRVLRREAFYRRLLAVADVLSAGLALMTSIAGVGDDQLPMATLLALPLVVVASKLIGLYERDELLLRKSTLDEAPALFQLATLYTLTIWLLEPLLIAGHLGHGQVFGIWSLLFVFT